ncbi:MAG: PBP1A family penicillin-binding protein, partial [Acidobacteria bacterium]|nr:PBP1A family penicillin-binding protein [Acidobacteriota bacterium]
VKRRALAALSVTLLVGCGIAGYYYTHFSDIIEARLYGERDRVIPRVFARPLMLHAGQGMTELELVARLNDLGYSQRGRVERAGEFTVDPNGIVLVPRGGHDAGQRVRVAFRAPPRPRVVKVNNKSVPPALADRIARIEVHDKSVAGVALDAPMLTALVGSTREKRRRVALDIIPARMQQAVLAIEDHRFYRHAGLDPIGIASALVTNMRGARRYLTGGSTITQQLARNFFFSQELAVEQQTGQRSYRRKLLEAFMALILESKASKDEILELYLNDVYLGHRGSFAIHGVAEAARIYFGRDVTNVSLSEAALIAGVIQSPHNHSPFQSLERAKERRDVVLQAMAATGYITQEAARRATAEPISVLARSVDNEAPYFVDFVGDTLQARHPGLTGRAGALDVYTTLDLNMQRSAQDAVREGLARVDQTLQRRRRRSNARPQAALVALDPRTGDILALVGGRSYNQSQFNRAVNARRQPGSIFKPFVYLAAFERALDEGRTDVTPATTVWDEPTTWTVNGEEWTPRNYRDEYDGQITLRRALAMSRNIATIKVAEEAGFDRVAAIWRKTAIGRTELRGYPSIALGVFELTPLEVASAYTLFLNGGRVMPAQPILEILSAEKRLTPKAAKGPQVATPETSFLLTHMMRSVINEGTGAGARAAGFALDAAGKSGTTNDLRDAWFVGFTPELIAVVWVGFDDNRPLGLSGTQAALPIWSAFMRKALAGHRDVTFQAPDGVTFADIDRDTGLLALPSCPRVTSEAFISGTVPLQYCDLHRF